MMLGRYKLGQTVHLWVNCRDGNRAPTVPDDVPVFRIYSGSALVKTGRMAVLDKSEVTGLFHRSVYLNGDFAEGFYTVVMTYELSSVLYSETNWFRVEPGGHADGHITSMYHYRRPNANFIVHGLETGKIVRGRNPRV